MICDDCRQPYEGPAYYTLGGGCVLTETLPDGTVTVIEHDCTGNIGPECADFLEPDDPDDPRRPVLFMYLVTLASGQQYRFAAEDADHALEQAVNAEPDDPVVSVDPYMVDDPLGLNYETEEG